MIVNCTYCNKEKEVTNNYYNWNISKRSGRFFCNRQCKSKWYQKNKPTKEDLIIKGTLGKYICEYCGKEFIRNICWQKRQKKNFCSVECKHLENRGKHKQKYDKNLAHLKLIIRQSFNYLYWRKKVFETGNYTCVVCNQRGGKLEVHHINPFNAIMSEYNIDNIDKAESCKALWNIDNGAILCKKCHKTFHNIYGKHFSTKEDYQEFIINKAID